MDRDLTYTIHLEPAEEGGYVVTVPALPAVITQGDNYAEAIAMAEDAIQQREITASDGSNRNISSGVTASTWPDDSTLSLSRVPGGGCPLPLTQT